MSYQIIRICGEVTDLEKYIREQIAEGWQPEGAPFRDEAMRQWCQAMKKPEAATKPGTMRLKEPKGA